MRARRTPAILRGPKLLLQRTVAAAAGHAWNSSVAAISLISRVVRGEVHDPAHRTKVAGREWLAQICDRLVAHSRDNRPAHCGRLGVELIVMATHGRGAVFDLLVGSVSHAVLRDSRVPVPLVPVRE